MKRHLFLTYSDIPTVREDILEQQGGVCLICGNPPKQPVLDHHHIKRIRGTGHVRGVLCSTCNVFLAKIENNVVRYRLVHNRLPQILRNIAEYLEQEQYPYVHPSERKRYK